MHQSAPTKIFYRLMNNTVLSPPNLVITERFFARLQLLLECQFRFARLIGFTSLESDSLWCLTECSTAFWDFSRLRWLYVRRDGVEFLLGRYFLLSRFVFLGRNGSNFVSCGSLSTTF